jgi:hypothetical protein
VFGCEIAVERFPQVLSDAQRVQFLQVRVPAQEDDPLDQPVGMMHFLDAFGARFGGYAAIAPILLQAVMQPVLADRGQLTPQRLVEIVDDLLVALHLRLPVWLRGASRAIA